ncbi:MAG: pentapeptide repeat-containing protein [Snowella sp.]|nr:pentapeptide repeat-containing protein [Snowella sp.]
MSYFTRSWNERHSTEPRFRQSKESGFKSRSEKFLFYYGRGQRNFSGQELSYIKLSEQDLSKPNEQGEHLNLSGSCLEKAVFISANLCSVNLSGVDLTEADLSHANLSEANLSLTVKAPLYPTKPQNQNLTRVKLDRAILSNANLTGADLAGAILNHANFSKANLSGANLQGAESRKSDFNNSDLTMVTLYFTAARETRRVKSLVWQRLQQKEKRQDTL